MKADKSFLVPTILLVALLVSLAALACLADGYVPTDLGVLDGYTDSRALAVNASGQIVGNSYTGGAWTSPETARACVWNAGDTTPTALPLLAGYSNSSAVDINSSGQILGGCYLDEYSWWCEWQACVWEYNTISEVWEVTAISPLAGDDGSYPTKINDAGEVIGQSINETDWMCPGIFWDGSTTTKVTNADGDPTWTEDINASGQVAAEVCCASVTAYQPVLVWSKADGATEATPGYSGIAHGINSNGEVAGEVTISPRDYPFIWLPAAAYSMAAGFHYFTYETTTYYRSFFTSINDAGEALQYLRSGTIAPDVISLQDLASGTATAEWSESDLANSSDFKMNASGEAIGSVASPATACFMSTDTGLLYLRGLSGPVLDGNGVAEDINDSGVIVGHTTSTAGPQHATRWTWTSGTNLPPVLAAITTPISGETDTPVTFSASATDPDGWSTVEFSLSGAPIGAAIHAATGAFTWTPSTAGTYSFDVVVTDGELSDSQSVTVNVVQANEPPVLTVPTETVNGVVGTTVTFTATATDPDGDALTFSLGLAPAGASINATTGAFTWTPTGGGSTSCQVMVSDGSLSDTETVNFFIKSAPSLSLPTTTFSGQVGSPVTFTATSYDQDGDTPVYGLSSAPAGASINSSTGEFAWTPTIGGDFNFSVTVSDGTFSDSLGVSIHINSAPVLTVPTSVSGTVGGLVTFTASAYDNEGGSLTFGLSGAPAGASINPTTGVFSWTPTATGTYTTTVTVSDGTLSDSEMVTIQVLNLSVTDIAVSCNKKGMAVVTVTIANATEDTIDDIWVTTASLNGAPAPEKLPVMIANNLKPGATKSCNLRFDDVTSGPAIFAMEGTCSLGGFSITQTVVIP